MIPLSNLHTHTAYCDGKGSIREIIASAQSMGLSSLGFSGHSYTSFDESYCMSREGTASYVSEISALQAANPERMRIYLGIEQDYFAEAPEYDFDYVIGAVHYVKKDGVYWAVDESAAMLRKVVEQCYGGDFYAYAEDYFAQVGQLHQRTQCQIVAHFDLLTKFAEQEPLFDESNHRYLDAAFAAITELCRADMIFELNTGAISRGYRTSPYPSLAILREIKKQGGRIILGSDSHSPETLLFGFKEAAELARSCGFRSLMYLELGSFAELPL